jgi:hypothetical protein
LLLSGNDHDVNSLHPMAGKGTAGTLAKLIKTRSGQSLHSGAASGSGAMGAGRDEEEGLVNWALRYIRDDSSDDEHDRRSLMEERRMNAILNGPHMRSMRLIGNSNPRYRWERYWKTDEELRSMETNM